MPLDITASICERQHRALLLPVCVRNVPRPEQPPHPTAPPRSVASARLSLAFRWTLSSLIALRTPQEVNSRSVRSRLACLMHVRSFCLIAVRVTCSIAAICWEEITLDAGLRCTAGERDGNSGGYQRLVSTEPIFWGHYSRPAFGAPIVSSRVTRGRAWHRGRRGDVGCITRGTLTLR